MIAETNGSHKGRLAPRSLPPYEPGRPYTLKAFEGEVIYIPLSKSAMRLLVTGEETEGAFALVSTGGQQDDPIGFHLHREAHDIFLCLKGNINVWAGDKCRTLSEGDLASVPPNTIHRFQILGEHSEFIGLIVPGGWEDFFRFIGEPYYGPMWHTVDDRNPFEVLIPKLKAAAEKYDMVPQPQHKGSEVQPWDGSEKVLPRNLEPYYLKAGNGPKYLVEGAIVKPLVTTRESAGKFSIGSIEFSSWHQNALLKSKMSFAEVHHALHVAQGQLEITIDEESTVLRTAETIYIPKGSLFTIAAESRFAQAYIFANNGGLLELLCGIGEQYEHSMIPEKEGADLTAKLRSAASAYSCQISS